jgi:hypothetical protein
MIVQDPPPTKPPDWKRSRIRREHLIALGIPVNLDEMVPHANGKPLPPLQISTRPMSAPPGPRHQTIASVARGSASRVASPDPAKDKPGSSISQLTFGTKPEIDENKISELLALDTGLSPDLHDNNVPDTLRCRGAVAASPCGPRESPNSAADADRGYL